MGIRERYPKALRPLRARRQGIAVFNRRMTVAACVLVPLLLIPSIDVAPFGTGGRLDECELTHSDIVKVKKAFYRMIAGSYLPRVDYRVRRAQ